MKKNILKLAKIFDELCRDEFDYTEFQLAVYMYCRFGMSTTENITHEDLQTVAETINAESSLFNEFINDNTDFLMS